MSQSRSIETIQHLRAVAAIGVVVFHALSQAFGPDGVSAYVRLGAAGVDLFFVISGFIMWVTAIDKSSADPARFAVRRLIRIVPLYWLMTTFILAVLFLVPGAMRSASFDAAHVIASYIFLAWPHPVIDGRLWPLVVPGWTLNYEMLFYAIVAVSLVFRRGVRAWLISAVIVGLIAMGLLLRPISVLAFYTDQILIEFLFGITIGMVYTRPSPIKPAVAYAALGVGILALLIMGPASSHADRAITWGVPMALIVFGSLNRGLLLAPTALFRLLGDASYSIYLTQFFAIAAGARVLATVTAAVGTDFWGKLLTSAAIVAVAIATGVVIYLVVERPLTVALRGWGEHNKSDGLQSSPLAAGRNETP